LYLFYHAAKITKLKGLKINNYKGNLQKIRIKNLNLQRLFLFKNNY